MSTVFKSSLYLGAFLLCVTFLLSCTHGPPFVRMQVENVRAKPNSHVIAVAVHYQQLRDPTGFLNTFPNGGVYKVLDRKAMIYLCDIDTLQVNQIVFMSPPESMSNSWEAWIQGWSGHNLYFTLVGMSGNSRTGSKDSTKIIYKIGPDNILEEVEKLPDDIAFQHNTGPEPLGTFVRVSKGHSDIDIKTEILKDYRTMFRTDNEKRALVSIDGSNR